MVEQEAMKEQMKEVVTFLYSNKEARDQALDIILNYTKTMAQRMAFQDTDVIKSLLRLVLECVSDEQTSAKLFQCLINFAIDKPFIQQCVELNAARRVFEFLMHNVKPSSSSIRTENATYTKEKMASGSGTIEVYEIMAGRTNSVQAAVMFLTNLSQTEEGQRHILGTDPKQRGAVLENLMGMFQYFKTSEMFDFVANIFANVSSDKQGRQWMVENPSVLKSVFTLIEDPETSKHRVRHLCETVRNCMFLWETHNADLK